MNNGNRPRAEQQRAHSINSPKPELEIEGDEQFFAHHPNRSFRMRPLSEVDIALIERAGTELELPPSGMQWIVVVWRMDPETRLKVICPAPVGVVTDAPEADCRTLYLDLTSPEKIALCEKLEVLLQVTEVPYLNNGGEF